MIDSPPEELNYKIKI